MRSGVHFEGGFPRLSPEQIIFSIIVGVFVGVIGALIFNKVNFPSKGLNFFLYCVVFWLSGGVVIKILSMNNNPGSNCGLLAWILTWSIVISWMNSKDSK